MQPKRRLVEVLRSHGMHMNQQVTFLTDGGEEVRELPLYLNPRAEHILDWLHLTMRLTVLGQYAKSLPAAGATTNVACIGASADPPNGPDEDGEPDGDEEPRFVLTRTEAVHGVERLKSRLWHGTVFRALHVIEDLRDDLAAAAAEQTKLARALEGFGGYIRANGTSISHNGERYRNDETISSAFVEPHR